jgi:hypothetical protein
MICYIQAHNILTNCPHFCCKFSEEELVVNTLLKNQKEELEILLSNTKRKLLKNGTSKESINVLAKEFILWHISLELLN